MKTIINFPLILFKLFGLIGLILFTASCSETIHEYKKQKSQEQIYQNRLKLYKENH